MNFFEYNCNTHTSDDENDDVCVLLNMGWTIPEYNRDKVNLAGNILLSRVNSGDVGGFVFLLFTCGNINY
jgi:hypothetical protein